MAGKGATMQNQGLLCRHSSDTAKPRRTPCFLHMILMMQSGQESWLAREQPHETASCISYRREIHIFLFFSHCIESGEVECGFCSPSLFPPPFFFPLYFIYLMASFKLGKITVTKHYLVHFKHAPPFLPLLAS